MLARHNWMTTAPKRFRFRARKQEFNVILRKSAKPLPQMRHLGITRSGDRNETNAPYRLRDTAKLLSTLSSASPATFALRSGSPGSPASSLAPFFSLARTPPRSALATPAAGRFPSSVPSCRFSIALPPFPGLPMRRHLGPQFSSYVRPLRPPSPSYAESPPAHARLVSPRLRRLHPRRPRPPSRASAPPPLPLRIFQTPEFAHPPFSIRSYLAIS